MPAISLATGGAGFRTRSLPHRNGIRGERTVTSLEGWIGSEGCRDGGPTILPSRAQQGHNPHRPADCWMVMRWDRLPISAAFVAAHSGLFYLEMLRAGTGVVKDGFGHILYNGGMVRRRI